MRYMRSLMVAFGLTSLVAGAAVAGLNPGNPGLPYANNRSAICIDCHSVAPGGGTHYGSHFVMNPFTADNNYNNTNTGGGWSGSATGPRNQGEYFRLAAWTGGAYSKYGGHSNDNQSYAFGGTNASRGAATLDTTAGNYASREIICESCHNLVTNVGGGNNLVAVLSTATYSAGTGDNVQVTGTATTGANVATAVDNPICVGCHGYLYQANMTSTGRFADTRKNNEIAAGIRGGNAVHDINGVAYAMNHHVMTSDQITDSQAGLGLLWRDVLTVPPLSSTSAMSTGSTLGQMPQRTTWATDGGKVKGGSNFTCMACHAAPHSGLNGAAASIIRDTDASTDAPSTRIATFPADRGNTTAIIRLGKIFTGTTARRWLDFNDVLFCNDCHKVAGTAG